jgi:uncharacterized protein YbcV (DUF1398 family)
MTEDQFSVAHACLADSENDRSPFPEIVRRLSEAGFERYAVDFCRGTWTGYVPSGDSVVVETAHRDGPIGDGFDVDAVKAAIREAQQLASGYTYAGFCEKVMRAGCVGYVVSFPGRRAVYSARTAEAHVEHFPN